MISILETGKDNYDPDGEFDRRTRAAVAGEPSEWGDPAELFRRDAVEVASFIEDDYPAVARVLSGLEGYSILDLGCGYGRLAPFLSAFDCLRYLGVDRVAGRTDLALARYASGTCDFKHADALSFRADDHGHDRFDVVWTSNVMQHLLLAQKLELLETAKAACSPGGRIILREAGIVEGPLADAELLIRSCWIRRMLTTSAPSMFSPLWPGKTFPPRPAILSVTSVSLISEPLTIYPRFKRSSAIPLIPIPPMPTKWICLTFPKVVICHLSLITYHWLCPVKILQC